MEPESLLRPSVVLENEADPDVRWCFGDRYLKGEQSIPFKTFFFPPWIASALYLSSAQVHSDNEKQKKGEGFPSPPYYPVRYFNIQ